MGKIVSFGHNMFFNVTLSFHAVNLVIKFCQWEKRLFSRGLMEPCDVYYEFRGQFCELHGNLNEAVGSYLQDLRRPKFSLQVMIIFYDMKLQRCQVLAFSLKDVNGVRRFSVLCRQAMEILVGGAKLVILPIASIVASSLILHTSGTTSRLSAPLQILLSIKFLTFDAPQ
ncbi:uncharacterized protein LOC103699143 isoform X1 [Phoenix dactylifera]|uniref:Uncharacterized protein LOC103699143 isoform X1 n=1 Tax=Phoenix dactylifera TaxID=42345 RepID=A0A8B8J6N1_PHODC|nr:uncharacterized protein LOC103699143 isoform X1 [Phoenix dactylifera]XP_026661947.2 uncharacterized protein LOC103699143 isoform X1 [Phoenix dactylifera]